VSAHSAVRGVLRLSGLRGLDRVAGFIVARRIAGIIHTRLLLFLNRPPRVSKSSGDEQKLSAFDDRQGGKGRVGGGGAKNFANPFFRTVGAQFVVARTKS
jgi:hypothetical protein